MRRPIAAGIATAAALILTATPADAHTPTIAAECGRLSVKLEHYEPRSTVRVTIDGRVEADVVFGTGVYSRDFTLDRTRPHVWLVDVDNTGDNSFDLTRSGTVAACVTPTTTRPQVVSIDLTPTTSVPVMNPPVILIPPLVELRAAPVAVVVAPEHVLAMTGPSRVQLELTAAWACVLVGALLAIRYRHRR